MGLENINTLKLLRELFINYNVKGTECKGIIIVADRFIEFF